MAAFNKTPLRYPGGKQKLTPFIIEILEANSISGNYAEPYAGGAGVGLELLLSKRIDHIHLNDSNPGIYAFWHSVVHNNEELCRLISTASLNVEEWKRHREIVARANTDDLLELGFSVFYLNRCNRSGVLSAGIIGGLDQTGNYKMDARFSRNDLIRRIEAIGLFRNQISVTSLDAELYIQHYVPELPPNSLVYLDPPYYGQGNALYMNAYKKSDHARLAEVIQRDIQHKWVLSYDGVPEILGLYQDRRHFLYDLQYSAARNYKGKEVFVFCDGLTLPAKCSLKHIEMGMQNLVYVPRDYATV